jgi:hypothetical protein
VAAGVSPAGGIGRVQLVGTSQAAGPIDWFSKPFDQWPDDLKKKFSALERGYTLNTDGASIDGWAAKVEENLVALGSKDAASRTIVDRIMASRVVAGGLPALRFAGRLAWPVGLAVTAYQVWEITHPDGSTEKLKIQGAPGSEPSYTPAAGEAIPIVEWMYDGSTYYYTALVPSPTLSNANTACYGAFVAATSTTPPYWSNPSSSQFNNFPGTNSFQGCGIQTGLGIGSRLNTNANDHCTPTPSHCFNSFASGDTATAAIIRLNLLNAYLTAPNLAGAVIDKGGGYGSYACYVGQASGDTCIGRRATEAELRGKLRVLPTSSGAIPYDGGSGVSLPATTPKTFTPTMTDGSLQNAINNISTDNSTKTVINNYLNGDFTDGDPSPTTPPATIALPQPEPWETYDAYSSRLRALGFFGEIQLLEGAAIPTVMAGAPFRLTVNFTQEVPVYDPTTGAPQPWPVNPPVLTPDSTLLIEYTPGYTPAVDNPDDPTCDCPDLDFGPLSVGATTKFPFGMFAYVDDFLRGSYAAAAPSFTLSKPGGGSMVVDFAQIDPARTIRDKSDLVIELVAVVASVWWLGSLALGLGKGERLEDAWPVACRSR